MEDNTSKLFELAAHGTGDELRDALKQASCKDQPAGVDSVRRPAKRYSPYPSANDSPGLTLLLQACSYGNASCVKTLLELGASPLERTPPDDDYFDIACACGYGTSLGEDTCMHLAAASGSSAVVDLLRAAGLDVNARSANKSTPLMAAANRYNRTMDLSSREDYKDTRERIKSLQQQESAAVQALIAAGADMDARCGEVHRSDLHPHKTTPHSQQMMRAGLRARVSSGLTALHWAANTGDYGVARSLVAAGADVNAATSSKSVCDKEQTPLHFAAELGDMEMVKLFVAGGADVNAKDSLSMTPLHQVFAVEEQSHVMWNCWRTKKSEDDLLASLKRDRLAIAEVLLRAGADRGATAVVAEHPLSRRKKSQNAQPEFDTFSALAGQNNQSGGLEFLDMLTTVMTQPRSLQSSCRLAIRKCLTRPILHQRNVDALPLPGGLKNYVSMETL